MPKLRIAASFAAALMWCLVGGCEGDGGRGRAVGAADPGGTDTSDTATVSAAPPSGPLADVDPCDTILAKEKRTLKLYNERPKKLGDARVCRWRYAGATIEDSFTIGVAIFDDKGIDDLNPLTDPKPITIGSHSGQMGGDPLSRAQTGDCFVVIPVTDHSLIETQTTGSHRKWAEKCEWSTRVMKLVEPRLP